MARNRFDVDETLETPFSMKHLKRSFVYVKRQAGKMTVALLLSAASAVLTLFIPLLTQRALDHSIPAKDVTELCILAASLVVCTLLSVLCIRFRAKIMSQVGNSIIYDMRNDLFIHLQKLPFSYYDDRPDGKILVRVVQYINSVSDLLSNGIINFVMSVFNIIFITIFMFATHVQLSLVILAGLPFLVAILAFLKPFQRKAWQRVSNKSSNLNAYLAESINGVRVTQFFVRELENIGIFEKLSKNARHAWLRAVVSTHSIGVFTAVVSSAVFCAVYLVGMLVLGPGAITLGTLVAMTSYADRFWQPITAIANLYNSFMNTISYLERIFETMDEPVTVCDAPDAEPLPPISGQVEYQNVTFGYEADHPVLENVSFHIKAGESIALVGPTGAGKTTIVNLLCRFYNLTGGKILLDGHDISQATLYSLRSQLGIMLQESFIFSGTIADNIKYGRPDATDDEMIRAAKTVHADEFIREFEKGYDTEVNERGSRLSQGQKQLIALARTLLTDPKILILDEATSSVDTKTERLMQEGLNRLMEGRTSFIIAHRLSTIKSCDKIMVVADKGIAECGSHDELMEKKGAYYRLYTAQLSDMK